MSWIVSLVKLNRDVQHLEEVEEADVIPLGTKAEILSLLRKWFPDADFHSVDWISFHGRDEVTEIIISGANELADDEMISSIGFRNPSYRLLRDVCRKMGWKAIDPSDGEFLDFAAVPPDHFVPYFVRKRPQPATYTIVDLVVYLRNQVMETWVSGETDALKRLASALQSLMDGFEDAGYNSPYWVTVDKLAYFARHHELADYQLYVPTEDEIRKHGLTN